MWYNQTRMLLCLAFLVSGPALAQNGTIRGTILDAGDGNPLPGATITLEGTSYGTAADIQGQFSFAAPAGEYTAQVSFVGFSPTTVNLAVLPGQITELNLTLTADLLQLGELVVTAMGIERQRQDLTYSVQQVDGDDLTRAPAPNVLNTLQGKIAGLTVTPSNGLPGASAHIMIRGANSIDADNQPLWVIDGIPVSGGDIGEARNDRVNGPDLPNRIVDLDPGDIESVSVLKGAAAAVLYGVRAANGAILVTTKKGRTTGTSNVDVSFSSNLSFENVSVLPDLQQTYAQGTNGMYNHAASSSWGPRLSELSPTITNAMGENVPRPTRPFDNVTPFFETGLTSTNNLNVSGANPYGNFNLSGSYTAQNGIVRTTGMDRLTLRLGGDYQIAGWLRAGGSVSYANTEVAQIAGGSFLSNPLFTLYWAPISFDLWGLPCAMPDNPLNQINYRSGMDNPIWSLENNLFTDNNDRFFGNVYATLTPSDRVTITYRLGSDLYTNRRKEVLEIGSGGTGGRTPVPSGGQIKERTVFNSETTSLLTASYNRPISRTFRLSLLAGSEVNYRYLKDELLTGNGLSLPGFRNISNASTILGQDEETEQMTVGLFGDLQLDYRSMLILSLTGRNDWASTMPEEHRSYFYPSAGLAFIFTEAFDLPEHIVSFGKLKASVAQVGQAAPVYSTTPVFTALSPTAGATSGFLGDGFLFPYNGIPGFTMDDVLLSGVRPQNTSTFETGIELAFLDSRIGLDYVVFRENNRNQIFEVPISSASGYTTELRNAGELRNSGHEVTLNLSPVRTARAGWDLSLNVTKLKSEVIELYEGVDNINLGGFVETSIRAEVGFPYPVIYGSRYLRDSDGNIVVDSRETIDGLANALYGMPMRDPEVGPIGNVSPDWTAGIGNALRLGNIQLFAQVDIRKGGKMYAGNTRLQKYYGMDAETEDRESAYVFPGVKGYINGYDADNRPIVSVEGANDIQIVRDQTYWMTAMDAINESNVYDTSFLRLREVRLSYSVPAHLLKGTNVRSLELSATGRNLLLFTNYPNFDPETNLGGAHNFQGMEYVNLPGSKSFGVGVKVQF